LYHQVRQQPDLPQTWQQMKHAFWGDSSWQLWLAILLMPLNWGLETWKWYLLVNRHHPISFWKAFEAVLSGLSLAINTPNRIGEYGGRVLYLKPEFRLKGVALTVLSSIAQLLITLLMGWFALWVLKPQLLTVHFASSEMKSLLLDAFQFGVFLLIVVTALFYLRIQWFMQLLGWIPLVKKKFSFALVLEHITVSLLLQVLFFSFLRFLVFAIQYILFWNALDASLNPWQGFWSIALVFLIMAIVPTFAIAELGIRGKVSVAIVGLYTTNVLALIAGTAGMWLLNLVLPALAGSLFLLTIKFFKDR
jgi:hypothetical protein